MPADHTPDSFPVFQRQISTTGNTVTDTSHLHPGEPVGKPHLTPSVHRGPVSDPSLSYNQPHPSPIHSSPDTKPRHLSSLHFQDCRPIPDPHTPSKPAGTTSPPPKEMLPPSRSPSVPALPCKIPPLISSYSTKYFQYFTFFCLFYFSNTQGRAREVRTAFHISLYAS